LLEILKEKLDLVSSHEQEEAVSGEFAYEMMELNEEIDRQSDNKELEKIWARLESEVKALMDKVDDALKRDSVEDTQRLLNRINFLNTSMRLAERKMGMDVDVHG